MFKGGEEECAAVNNPLKSNWAAFKSLKPKLKNKQEVRDLAEVPDCRPSLAVLPLTCATHTL